MAGEPPIEFEDLRAGVSAGLISEAQAADLAALSRARAAGAKTGDEPFELFRGFNEVFVTLGVVLLIWGLRLILPFDHAVNAGGVAVISWVLAEYFTRHRRMILPSIALCLVFAAAVLTVAGIGVLNQDAAFESFSATVAIAAVASLLFHFRFRLPFALFPAGLLILVAALAAVGAVDDRAVEEIVAGGWSTVLDLNLGGSFALVTLIFGLAAFALAMSYDMRDPHRVTSRAACGFWLHILAGPAIVNTAAFTFRGMEGGLGAPLLTGFMLFMALIAIVIDRRSFLIAASGYLAAIVTGAIREVGVGSTAGTLILLGVGILILGAGWTGIRGRVIRLLPDFPGKDRLPPYRKDAA